MLCPKCGGEMKIISFITETDIGRKFLTHLVLWEDRTPVERPTPVEISDIMDSSATAGRVEESHTSVH